MALPFSRDAFLDLFAVYNTSLWPLALALWIATALAFAARLYGSGRDEWTFALLAIHWAWAGVAYHAALFTRINPAAWLFAVLFLLQAGLLIQYGVVTHRLRLTSDGTSRERVGYAFIAYGLLYPAIVLAGGHSYPRSPTFGVPCPTTIVTAGFLLLVARPVPLVTIIPVLWALIGGSAAFVLGVRADLALLVAAVALGLSVWMRKAVPA